MTNTYSDVTIASTDPSQSARQMDRQTDRRTDGQIRAITLTPYGGDTHTAGTTHHCLVVNSYSPGSGTHTLKIA